MEPDRDGPLLWQHAWYYVSLSLALFCQYMKKLSLLVWPKLCQIPKDALKWINKIDAGACWFRTRSTHIRKSWNSWCFESYHVLLFPRSSIGKLDWLYMLRLLCYTLFVSCLRYLKWKISEMLGQIYRDHKTTMHTMLVKLVSRVIDSQVPHHFADLLIDV